MRKGRTPTAKQAPRRNLQLRAALVELSCGMHDVGILSDRKLKAMIKRLDIKSVARAKLDPEQKRSLAKLTRMPRMMDKETAAYVRKVLSRQK